MRTVSAYKRSGVFDMPLEAIVATPHPAGNRIDLSFLHPDVAAFPGLRLVRRQSTHPLIPEPASPAEGLVVADTQPAADQSLIAADAEGVFRVSDLELQAETVYYYSIFPYLGDPPVFDIDRHNRAAALATAPNGFADWMYQRLPAIYHRYDNVVPRADSEGLAELDLERGQLRRFLDLPGGEVDRIYSLARALLDAHNLARVDGTLLPLLAEWIGWKTDRRLEIAAQRNEIRNAPSIYRRIGILPVVASTVKRVSTWESRSKEFVHNVFASNRPERLNLWLSERDGTGSWSHADTPFSLDFAYAGRPAAAPDDAGVLWLFQATAKRGGSALWSKTFTAVDGWSPSAPLVISGTVDRHPAAALQGGTLWLFWESYDETAATWRVRFAQRAAGQWSAAETLGGETSPDRRRPAVAADDAGGLWLFYQERDAGGWAMRYNRHDGTDWQLATAATLPPDGSDDPRVESDPFVVVRPGAADRRLWLLWARRATLADPTQSRWSVVYRVKDGLDPSDTSDWNAIQTLSKPDANAHDREPAALVDAAGDLELFWSATRDGGWSIWRATVDAASGVPGTAESITIPPYSQRVPLPVEIGPTLLLVQGSNRSVTYSSDVYRAMQTVDGRYAGSTTVATGDVSKIALRGGFEDFQTYSYDAGKDGLRDEDDWYARDTIGLYLTPDTLDEAELDQGIGRLTSVLKEFMPVTDRAVFIPNSELHTDYVYTYGLPASAESHYITSTYEDELNGVLTANAFGVGEGFSDSLDT